MHPHEHGTGTCCEEGKKRNPLTGRTALSVAALAALIAFSYFFPGLELFRLTVFEYLGKIWWAVLLGFFLGGLLERYVPREYISLILAKRKKRTILFSVLLGFAMSACSHGILALSVQLHKKGASTPGVVAFLLASPWANLPVTLLLFVFFGLKALYIILGALLIAFTTGVVFQFLEKRGQVEANRHTVDVAADYSILGDVSRRMKEHRWSAEKLKRDSAVVLRGAWELADMVLCWILLGVALSGFAAAFIPAHFFQSYMGPSAGGLLVILGLATILEVCSEGTAPLAFEIFKQTGAFGNVFVFLMAGIVTDFTEISVIWANVGRRAAIWIPLVAVPQVVVLGVLANILFR
ncbi:MAG: permease [Candidatus Omnitrophota bacterium]